jgi:hypothetical protein
VDVGRCADWRIALFHAMMFWQYWKLLAGRRRRMDGNPGVLWY